MSYDVARALTNLAWGAVTQRLHALADRHITAGLEYCSERDLDLARSHLLALRSRADLNRGRWAEAADSAAFVLREPRPSAIARVPALVTSAVVRARRGDPEAWPLLDEALAVAERSGELQLVAPTAAARAEVAWLEGRHGAIDAATAPAFQLAQKRRSRWAVGELAYWRWRAGLLETPPECAAEPYALQIAGASARAAELWTRIGCPYEAALALAETDDEAALRRSLEELQGLGARPAAAIVARRLRQLGARGLRRGPRLSTRENPAGLTDREVEVLALVACGLHNSDIAKQLFLSVKTVDQHVSSVLRKLGARTRSEASVNAVRLGLTARVPTANHS